MMKEFEPIKGPFVLKTRIAYSPGSVVSQQITKNDAGNITLFAFDEGQQLSEHTAPFDAVIQIIEGKVEIHLGGVGYHLKEGEMLIMPANVPHAVYATTQFKMLLTMIKG